MAGQTYKIANYFTSVDLAQGLATNLAEIELALNINPEQFSTLILLDQAAGREPDTAIFPTGWDGIHNDSEDGFSQPSWPYTGIGLVQRSAAAEDTIRNIKNYAEDSDHYRKYSDLIQLLLNKTGSSVKKTHPDTYNSYLQEFFNSYPQFSNTTLGLSTTFTITEEKLTGSPQSFDYLLRQSNTQEYFGSNPHAIFLSNHGNSYLGGGNLDGPEDDRDQEDGSLEVYQLANSLKSAINSNLLNQSRFGLVAYDECLMAGIETLTELSSTTRYFLASQETIPGNGFDYLRTLSNLSLVNKQSSQEGIEQNSKTLGLAFVNTYSERNGSHNTLSLSDTTTLAPLNGAIRDYANAFILSSDTFLINLLKSIRQKGTGYHLGFLQDLGNVALISRSTPGASTALINASNKILQALENTIVANNQNYKPQEGFRLNASSGLTITLPTAFDQWIKDDHYVNQYAKDPLDRFTETAPSFEQATGWSRVINRVLPLLAEVQTNSGFESSKAIRLDAEITQAKGKEAWLALQIDGYLSYTSNDAAINQTQITLPRIEGASIADLEFHLDILNLRQAGSASITIRSSEGTEKARWNTQIKEEGTLILSGNNLNPSQKNQTINAGDQVVITPDRTISARYDFDLRISNQSLQGYAKDQDDNNVSTPPNGDVNGDDDVTINDKTTPITAPSLFNFSIGQNQTQVVYYETPVAPPINPSTPGTFTTDIVLLSSSAGLTELTITDTENNNSNTFRSNVTIDEYIKLDSNTTYKFEIKFDQDPSDTFNSNASSDISLLIDHYGNHTTPLKDSLVDVETSIKSWGQVNVNQDLQDTSSIVEMTSTDQIEGLRDLQEGQAINASYRSLYINRSTALQAKTNGGTQTFSSGIWSPDNDINLEIWIEGTSANTAQLGFFQVDTLTGAFQTSGGLIRPSDSEGYRNLALDRLIAPLTDLKTFNKKASLSTRFEADQSYGAILLTTNDAGTQTTLYSIAAANPNQAIQFLNFGDGYFGFEDLLPSQTSSYDGDFNDITFHLA